MPGNFRPTLSLKRRSTPGNFPGVDQLCWFLSVALWWSGWMCFGWRARTLLSCEGITVVWSAVAGVERLDFLGHMLCYGRWCEVYLFQLGGCPGHRWLCYYVLRRTALRIFSVGGGAILHSDTVLCESLSINFLAKWAICYSENILYRGKASYHLVFVSVVQEVWQSFCSVWSDYEPVVCLSETLF